MNTDQQVLDAVRALDKALNQWHDCLQTRGDKLLKTLEDRAAHVEQRVLESKTQETDEIKNLKVSLLQNQDAASQLKKAHEEFRKQIEAKLDQNAASSKKATFFAISAFVLAMLAAVFALLR
jgi:hypothetical protein